MKTKVTYIISNIDKALAFEWISETLSKAHFSLSFILLNPGDSALERYLKAHEVPLTRISYRGKKDFFAAFMQLRKLLKQQRPAVIHCHLFDAAILGLMAGKMLGIPKRIFTRHHSTMHHTYFPRAVYYDKFINSLATHIIAITENVKQVLVEREGVKPDKVQIVHHGFKLEAFDKSQINEERIRQLAKKYQTADKYPVIGVIARQTHWKGIQFVIPAFQKLLEKYPNAHLVLANAKGDYKAEIDVLLAELPRESYTEITFEQDLFALYQLFDVYVHTPIDTHSEAFGQTYVEALAAGIPSVFSLSGVAPEFIQDEKNALVVPHQNSEVIYEKIIRSLELPEPERKKITQQGQEDVKKMFSLSQMIDKLSALYDS